MPIPNINGIKDKLIDYSEDVMASILEIEAQDKAKVLVTGIEVIL